MLTNYFKIGLRNLLKHKLFSTITVIGMAISLASCLLISIYVWDEISFDRFYPDADRTYRVYNIRTGNDGITNYLPLVPPTFGPTLEKDYPEVESTLRIMDTYGSQLFEIKGDKIKESKGVYAEQTVFDMLAIQLQQGDASSALVNPKTVILSESMAKKYYSTSNPVGEMITISGDEFQIIHIWTSITSCLLRP